MTPERWQQVKEIFNAALDRSVDQRETFLDEACGGDLSLRQQLERLINSHEQAGDFIEAPAAASQDSLLTDEAVTLQPDPMIGRQIGAYRLVREIGRGGMGAVYLAVRADQEFRQRVAIKLVKRGMDTDFVIRRFRNERQILAALNHPNIARLLDGGTTDDGLPYFVMEYIEGSPIHRYCDTLRLSVAERLGLFRQVCAAVAYAHEQKVIHRDIKPGNILVAEDGTTKLPKLLDFGIAKILDPDLAADTLDPTVTAMRLMTPDYASPEQARGEQVTDATDQYSLGVLLYELLTGQRPHHLRHRPPHEIARIISEEEPERPSDVVTRTREVTASDGRRTITLTPETVSHNRSSSPGELRRELAGGLDDIVMQALDKDPQYRYGSVQELSQDISRYLQGLPIIAPGYFERSEQETTAETAASEPGRPTHPNRSTRVEAALAFADKFMPSNKGARIILFLFAGSLALFTAFLIVVAGFLTFITAVDYFFDDTPGSPHPQTPALRAKKTLLRLTNNNANDGLPAWSPDGKKIAFHSNRDGKNEIYVMDADGSNVRRLTNNLANDDVPRWSPDGRKIVFDSERDGNKEIYVMDADGGNQTRLTRSKAIDTGAMWSPDGSRIAFATNRGNSYPFNFDIYVMNANGSAVKRIVRDPEYDAEPRWSPDGSKILFVTGRNNNFDVYVMDADGSNQKNLTADSPKADGAPAWSLDGSNIAIVSRRDGNDEIYVTDADGGNLKRVTYNSASDTRPSWAPDGSKLAFQTDRDGNWEIYVMSVDGELDQLTDDAADDIGPAWSPDGAKIAFSSNRAGMQHIYIMNADGSSPAQITNSPADDTEPAWSPDGKRIAFTSSRDGNREIYLMNADGSNQTRLTADPAIDIYPKWSPDGRILFNSTRDGQGNLYVMDDDGANVTRFTKLGAGQPAWSPDGRKVAFAKPTLDKTTGRLPPQIYTVDADGSNITMLTSRPNLAGEPCWSPESAKIAFVMSVDKMGARVNIFQMDSDGGNLRRLTAGPAADQRPSLSPDGSKLAFQSNRDGNYEIYVMNLR